MPGKSGSRKHAGAVMGWLASVFPDVACSLAAPPTAFAPAAAFWASAEVEACLAYQDRLASGMDDKIRAAHLIAFYSHQFALVAGALHLSRVPVQEISVLRFETYPRSGAGRTHEAGRFHFLVDVALAQDGADDEERHRRFHDAFVAHLEPAIAFLKRRCGLSRRAQWRLAADSLAGAFLEIGRRRGREEAVIERALAIVKRQGSPLFSRELHYEKIDVAADGGERMLFRTYRMRGGCCLYYRSEGGDFCDTCVLLEAGARRERLRAHLRGGDGEGG